MKAKKTDNGKITALYERLSRDDDLTGDSNSIGSYHLLRRKSDFAKLTQKKNAATSKKITTLSKSCSVLSRTFLFALFFDFGNLLCRCGYNPYACIAHTVKKRVKLPPLRVLLRRRF